MLALLHPLLQRFELGIGHAHTVVGHGNAQHITLEPDPEQDAAVFLPAGESVEEGVFHDGLQGKGGDADMDGIDLDLLVKCDASVKAGLLDVDIILQRVKLLLQRDDLLLGAQVVAEDAAQGEDHPVGIRGILQQRHAGDQIQGETGNGD